MAMFNIVRLTDEVIALRNSLPPNFGVMIFFGSLFALAGLLYYLSRVE